MQVYIVLLTSLILYQYQFLTQYNNRQDFYNSRKNPTLPICVFGNSIVCSTKNETFANMCVLMLLGQQKKHNGWCKDKIIYKQKSKQEKTMKNGYLQGEQSQDQYCHLCNDVFNPVCGENGVTYQNLCKLKECARIKLVNYSPCGIPDYQASLEKCQCEFIFKPVCGQDFVTYQNKCLLNCAGVRLQNIGPCRRECGCSKIELPVCGLNRKTYLNACEMQCKGIEKRHDGECPNPRPMGCEHCEGFYNAVCGVNGMTYDNLCYLHCAKVKLFRKGICPHMDEKCQCHERYAPVCGIDNKSYRNECFLECVDIRKQYNGICRNYQVDVSEIFGKCKCDGVQQVICGQDNRTYLNPCFLDCLGGGNALHWGECRYQYKNKCNCEEIQDPVCGQDLKTYENICIAKCLKIQIKHNGRCNEVGFIEEKNNYLMNEEIQNEFEYNNY